MRILGIDPGSRITGYGVIESEKDHCAHIASGSIQVKGDCIADKLGVIFHEISQLVEMHRPEQLSVEQVFVSRNVASALKLGHARGAAICAAVNYQLPVSEYSPRTIKRALVGTGAADKVQIQHMVQRLLGLEEYLQADAADALAVALCHAHTIATIARYSIYQFKRRR